MKRFVVVMAKDGSISCLPLWTKKGTIEEWLGKRNLKHIATINKPFNFYYVKIARNYFKEESL